jgi:hypothetical protein
MNLKQQDIMTVLLAENVRGLGKEHMTNRACTIFGSTATREEISEVVEKLFEARGMRRMFEEVNKDCAITKESVVDFTDTEYYAQQIQNIYEFDDDKATEFAELMKEIGG